ncbi:MAG: DUF367 domain-containing protein [Thermoplasmata archaeon]|nr:DUF367 domain-containing protein [Thermoplasmata archaeon]
MPSSGSTRLRPADPELRLLLVVAGDDHPRACTGRRLLRTGRVHEVPATNPPKPAPLLLDPHAELPLSPADRARIERAGLLGVDCSWKGLERRGGYPATLRWLDQLRTRRRLPWLLAANPQHFGRLAELNTAEAFAASSYILGEMERARTLLSGFAGGEAFFEMNATALEGYREARDVNEVLAVERGGHVGRPTR